jgi:hypothetical protein
MPRPPFVSALSAVGDGGDDSDTGPRAASCSTSIACYEITIASYL